MTGVGRWSVVFCAQNYFSGVTQHSFNGVTLAITAAGVLVGVSSLMILTLVFLSAQFHVFHLS